MAFPVAYLLTFTCYGLYLHGDERGSVDRDHNCAGGRSIEPNRAWVSESRRVMADRSYRLGPTARQIVLESIRSVCAHRQWELLAAHVRTTHAHVVVSAPVPPEVVLHDLKAYASRALNKIESSCRRWTRHGSTRYLWSREDVGASIDYVVRRQGPPMAVHCLGEEPRSITVAAP
jgi:REP element-mobilizing transposase RayT